jgi:CRISPR/Cas system-associated exonuclease Cas4 (RecB family)
MKILNKSQANCFLDCPYKWYKIYVEGIKSKPSPAQKRGTRIHSKIENFYKNMLPDLELKNFINFEYIRLKDMIKEGKFDRKYFFPLFQELSLYNEEIGLKGTCDAIYINPKDDELILIDWKTGKHYGEGINDYKFELCVYSELLNHSGKTDQKVKYIGIYFVDQNELYFEEIKQEDIDNMYKIMNECRWKMENEEPLPKKNKWCWNCQFKGECPLFKK